MLPLRDKKKCAEIIFSINEKLKKKYLKKNPLPYKASRRW
jgi:hypothetical protein